MLKSPENKENIDDKQLSSIIYIIIYKKNKKKTSKGNLGLCPLVVRVCYIF